MRIAMIQMASASGDVERNISRAFPMMEEAAEKSDLLVLPELWTIGYNFHHFEEHILSRHAALLEKLSDFARTHRVTLSPWKVHRRVQQAASFPRVPRSTALSSGGCAHADEDPWHPDGDGCLL